MKRTYEDCLNDCERFSSPIARVVCIHVCRELYVFGGDEGVSNTGS